MRFSKTYAKYICTPKYAKDFMTSLEEAYSVMLTEVGEQRTKIGYDRCIDRLLRDYFECYAAKMISLSGYKELVSIVGSFLDKGDSEGMDVESIGIPKTEDREMLSNANQCYRVGDLITPKDLDELPILSTPKSEFIAPNVVDLRDYCVATQNQEDRPWCAAYAACGFASNILWRKFDVPKVYNPEQYYQYAKMVDRASSLMAAASKSSLWYSSARSASEAGISNSS